MLNVYIQCVPGYELAWYILSDVENANSKNVIIFWKKKTSKQKGFSIWAAILDAMLEFTVEKISK